jgi:hypothetical protein
VRFWFRLGPTRRSAALKFEVNNMTSEWQRKNASFSDKTARKEFGLTQDEIVKAIRAGRLQCRVNSIYGNPFIRLLRREVEALVENECGGDYLRDRQARPELRQINWELKKLHREIAALEERKAKLMAGLAI